MKKYNFEFCMKHSCNGCKRSAKCEMRFLNNKKRKPIKKSKIKVGERGGEI